MKKTKRKLKIDWKSKLIDLLIVIVGITIAFQLNTLNESKKSKTQEKDYLCMSSYKIELFSLKNKIGLCLI